MEAQVHILCSHCEKVLVEVQKDKTKNDRVINIEEEPLQNVNKRDEKRSSLDFKSESQEELDESSFCEIKIDYSKNEKAPSSAKSGRDIHTKLEQPEASFSERKLSGTLRKLDPALDKLRRIVGYETGKQYFF